MSRVEIRRHHVVFLVALLLCMAAVLRWMGRVWWCAVGDLSPWAADIWSPHNSQHLVDPYTLTHALHGMLLYAVLWWLLGARLSVADRGMMAVSLEACWEIVENTETIIQRYREATISLDYHGDSVINSVGDTLGFVAGYVLAASIPTTASVLGFIVTDVLLVLWIRDGLFLNVLMLLYPIEAVKDWQMEAAGSVAEAQKILRGQQKNLPGSRGLSVILARLPAFKMKIVEEYGEGVHEGQSVSATASGQT